jgi:hypothetical protein
VLFVYLIASVFVAWLGRNRILGFWGNLILALILTPLIAAIVLIIGTPVRRKGLTKPAKTVTG